MDGTIYLGNKLLPYAKELISYLLDKNIDYVFLTNNSSSDKINYLKKINQLGLEATLNHFYSSIDHTVRYLLKNKIQKVFCLAETVFKNVMIGAGIEVIDTYEKDQIDAVIVGFDKHFTFETTAIASRYIQDGVKVIASHPDKRCPIEDGYYVPDCGALIDHLNSAYPIKDLTVLGKPHPDMLLDNLREKGYQKEEALIIGDRHFTDVLCGIHAGVDSGLILTGESTVEDLKNLSYKPTFIFENLKSVMDYLKSLGD